MFQVMVLDELELIPWLTWSSTGCLKVAKRLTLLLPLNILETSEEEWFKQGKTPTFEALFTIFLKVKFTLQATIWVLPHGSCRRGPCHSESLAPVKNLKELPLKIRKQTSHGPLANNVKNMKMVSIRKHEITYLQRPQHLKAIRMSSISDQRLRSGNSNINWVNATRVVKKLPVGQLKR